MATVETDIQSTDITHPLVLKLPETLSVTKHHVEFVRCEDVDTANAVKKCMEQQWSTEVYRLVVQLCNRQMKLTVVSVNC